MLTEVDVAQLLPPKFWTGATWELAEYKPKLIGVCGKARAGKDTIGAIVCSEFGAQQVYFAKPLKDGLGIMLNLSSEQLYGDEKETPLDWLGKSPRQMLQTLGTDWGRKLVHDDIWLKIAERAITSYMEAGLSVVVTDARFDNEAEMIQRLGGRMWRVERPGNKAVASHVSEAGISDHLIDHVFINDGSLADLTLQVADEF